MVLKLQKKIDSVDIISMPCTTHKSKALFGFLGNNKVSSRIFFLSLTLYF